MMIQRILQNKLLEISKNYPELQLSAPDNQVKQYG